LATNSNDSVADTKSGFPSRGLVRNVDNGQPESTSLDRLGD
jgi:hypothetical protein